MNDLATMMMSQFWQSVASDAVLLSLCHLPSQKVPNFIPKMREELTLIQSFLTY
jgi:hypothetical protein